MPPDAPNSLDPHAVPEWLLGRWRLLRAEQGLDFAPGVRMEFKPGGRLVYTIVVEGHEHLVKLIYQVDGDTLRTDNPDHPHATSTRFALGEGGVLVFDFSGPRAWFIKET